MKRTLLLAALLVGCGEGTASQYTFAREWIALSGQEDPVAADVAFSSLVRTWKDRRMTWDVQIVEALCRDGGCNVLPFDCAKLPAQANLALGGAMPRFELRAADYRALTQRCLALHEHCVARIEARLTQLPESMDAPLVLQFEDGRLQGVRALRKSERYHRPPPLLPRDVVRRRRT